MNRVPPFSGLRRLEAGDRRFLVTAPAWLDWQQALDRSAAGGLLEPWHLAAACLRVCVLDEGAGGPVDPALLSDADRDRLLDSVLDLVEEQRQALGLTVRETPGGAEVTGGSVHLRLRRWTFRERSNALRTALRLQPDGEVAVDLTAFERLMTLACVTGAAGEPLDAAAVDSWPIPLGELVTQTLDRLNTPEPEYAATLAACIRTGREHPDLQLLRLCQTFGWSPAEVLALESRTAERLLTAALLVQPAPVRAIPASAVAVQTPAAGDEGVTRILVSE